MKTTLTSIQQSRLSADKTSERLATGLRVNDITDQPTNFFTAASLTNRANDYSKLLDGLSLGVQTIRQAVAGTETLENILNLAELKAIEARDTLEKTGSALPDAILEDAPVGYFRLGDADGATAVNLGTLGAGGDGIYQNGVTQGDEILFYGAGGLPAKFSGSGQYVAVPNDDSINQGGPFPERTVELIFNADSTAGRQVLWEEGGTVNSLSIYIDDGLLRVTGRTTSNGGYGPLDISVPINAGESYHVAFTQDGPNSRFTGYLNGEAFGSEDLGGAFIGNHPNANGIGAINQNLYFHDDGPGNAPARGNGTFAFTGQISDLAIYNSIIPQAELQERYEATSLPLSESFRQDMQVFLEQIQGVVEDTQYRGVNLLNKEDLVVKFDQDNKSKLKVDGEAFSIKSLGLDDINFQKPSQVEDAINRIRQAIADVREYGTSLANDLNIIETRQDFSRNLINNHKSGAMDLLIADQAEEGANLLASQTRISLGTTALSLGSQSQQSILSLFGNSSGLFA